MIIDQSIVDRAGRILIARNTPMDNFHKASLLKMGIGGVYIREGEEDEKKEENDNNQVVVSAEVQKVIEKIPCRTGRRSICPRA